MGVLTLPYTSVLLSTSRIGNWPFCFHSSSLILIVSLTSTPFISEPHQLSSDNSVFLFSILGTTIPLLRLLLPLHFQCSSQRNSSQPSSPAAFISLRQKVRSILTVGQLNCKATLSPWSTLTLFPGLFVLVSDF